MSTPTPSAPPSGPPAGPPGGGPPPRDDERRQEQRDERPGEQPERRQREEERPPWEREGGEPFDPERAWRQLQALRTERDRARTERDDFRGRIEEHDRSQMSEHQRMEADRDGQRQRADTAEAQVVALRAALQHGIPAADLDDFVDLLGTGTAEQLANRAERLAPRFAASPAAPPPTRTGPPPSTRPTETPRRRGGGDPTQEPEETDLDKIGERIMNRR